MTSKFLKILKYFTIPKKPKKRKLINWQFFKYDSFGFNYGIFVLFFLIFLYGRPSFPCTSCLCLFSVSSTFQSHRRCPYSFQLFYLYIFITIPKLLKQLFTSSIPSLCSQSLQVQRFFSFINTDFSNRPKSNFPIIRLVLG